jgi:eukaryotic-like serine/threonine-protein kinase
MGEQVGKAAAAPGPTEREADTASLDEWPVDPLYASQLSEPALDPSSERGTVVLEHDPRRLPPTLAVVAVALILLLGAALVWALARNPGGGTPAARTTTDGTATPSVPARAGVQAAATRSIDLPRLAGLPADVAAKALRELGLRVERSARASTQAAGTVVGQSPAAGAHARRGATVRLVIARAQAQPATAGASTPTSPTTTTSTTPTTTTTTTTPAPVKVLMPKLVGLSIATAQGRLRAQGLHASLEKVVSSTDPGTVVAQTPVTGAQLRRGMTVTLRVAGAPAEVAVPDVTGLDEAAARSQLTAAGLTVESVDQSVTDGSQDGVVTGVDPSAGTRLAKRATVTITVGRFTATS